MSNSSYTGNQRRVVSMLSELIEGLTREDVYAIMGRLSNESLESLSFASGTELMERAVGVRKNLDTVPRLCQNWERV